MEFRGRKQVVPVQRGIGDQISDICFFVEGNFGQQTKLATQASFSRGGEQADGRSRKRRGCHSGVPRVREDSPSGAIFAAEAVTAIAAITRNSAAFAGMWKLKDTRLWTSSPVIPANTAMSTESKSSLRVEAAYSLCEYQHEEPCDQSGANQFGLAQQFQVIVMRMIDDGIHHEVWNVG